MKYVCKILFSVLLFCGGLLYSAEEEETCPKEAAELFDSALNSFSENDPSAQRLDKIIGMLTEAEAKGFKPLDELFYVKGAIYSHKEDYKNALVFFRKAAALGNVDGMLEAALYCLDGRGTKENTREALKWYEAAAEKENADAMFMTGFLYSENLKNHRKAFEWFKRAAENNNISAKRYLAECYDHGKGTAVNIKEAKRWYSAASDDGCKQAQASMCVLLFKGHELQELLRYADILSKNRNSEGTDLLLADAMKAYASLYFKDYRKVIDILRNYKALTAVLITLIALIIVTPLSLFIFAYLFIVWFMNRHKAPAVHPLTPLDSVCALVLFVVMSFAFAILTCPLALFFNNSIVFLLATAFAAGLINVLFWILIIKIRRNSVISGLYLHAPQIKPHKAFLYVAATYALIVLVAEIYELLLGVFDIKLEPQEVAKMICATVMNSNSSLEIVSMVFLVAVCLPLAEEILFRGVIFGGFRPFMPFWGAALLSSGMFALVHFDVLYFIPLLIMGLALCYLREKTKSLYLPIIIHCLNNLVSVIVCFYYPL